MEWIDHDNSGTPAGLTPDTSVECEMFEPGDMVYGMVKDIDWHHETDPVRRYRVLQFRPAAVLH